MQKPGDELLVAYLDGELDESSRAEIEAWLEHDSAGRDRVARLTESASLLRAAFDVVLREEVPERLIAAAHGASADAAREAEILPFLPRRRIAAFGAPRHWWIAVPVAASLFGLLIGGGLGYFGLGKTPGAGGEDKQVAALSASTNGWLDNAAEYHRLFVGASTANSSFADIPAKEGDGGDVMQKLSERTGQDGVRAPNLKPWGLIFQGARLVAFEGHAATQFIYTADDKTIGKAIGPLTVLIGSSKRPELAPTFDRRQDTNVLYWRRKGHAYAIVGQAEPGYMWNLVNDIAYQLDAI
jgi:anti-sigma factor RsiW